MIIVNKDISFSLARLKLKELKANKKLILKAIPPAINVSYSSFMFNFKYFNRHYTLLNIAEHSPITNPNLATFGHVFLIKF